MKEYKMLFALPLFFVFSYMDFCFCEDASDLRVVIEKYKRIACEPADDIKQRKLSLPIKIVLPEKFSKLKFKVTLQCYEPTWIDSRNLPKKREELSYSEPEDTSLANQNYIPLRRSKEWGQKGFTENSYKYVGKKFKSQYSLIPEKPYDVVNNATMPLRYWYRLNIKTENDEFVALYSDWLNPSGRDKSGPGGYSSIDCSFYKKTHDGWKRSYYDLGNFELRNYLRYDYVYELLKKYPFVGMKKNYSVNIPSVGKNAKDGLK